MFCFFRHDTILESLKFSICSPTSLASSSFGRFAILYPLVGVVFCSFYDPSKSLATERADIWESVQPSQTKQQQKTLPFLSLSLVLSLKRLKWSCSNTRIRKQPNRESILWLWTEISISFVLLPKCLPTKARLDHHKLKQTLWQTSCLLSTIFPLSPLLEIDRSVQQASKIPSFCFSLFSVSSTE